MAARAAFVTTKIGGGIPQLRHGGIFVCELAVAGSKLEGMGLEKEHIGQTQVAFGPSVGFGVMVVGWLFCRECELVGVYGLVALRREAEPCLMALEYKVILGEDLRKRA